MPAPHERNLEALVPGAELRTARGACYLVATAVPADAPHGGYPLCAFLELNGAAIAAVGRDPTLAELPLSATVFLDVETTGLAGGTGTPAFLVGVGFFDGDRFQVEQYFLRRLGEEPALCQALEQRLSRFGGIVSFNGRSFDLPLLETRFRLARMRPPLTDALHFDLLHAARRLWRTTLPGCALGTLEARLLDVRRTEDVESWRIPSIYLDYLRTGDASELRLVFEHNRYDLLSLVALALRACQTVEAAWHSVGSGRCARPRLGGHELASLGRLHELNGDPQQAARLYRAALAERLESSVQMQTLIRLAALHKRAGEWVAAIALWERLADEHPAAAVFALVELAKYHEHRARDPVRAYTYALRARREHAIGWVSSAAAYELGHRLARLERQLQAGRQPGPGDPVL